MSITLQKAWTYKERLLLFLNARARKLKLKFKVEKLPNETLHLINEECRLACVSFIKIQIKNQQTDR